MKFNKNQLRLYGITDQKLLQGRSMKEMVEQALQGGATCIQLREKNLNSSEKVKEAKELVGLCHAYQVPLIIDDDVDVALLCKADGVHVGMEDESVASIRARVPKDFIIGATAKTVKQAQEAQVQGADYLGVGALFPSPTKKNAIRITREDLIEIQQSMDLPIVAIGGLTYDNIDVLEGTKVNGIAVVSALFGEKDTKKNAERLLEKVKKII